MKMLTILLDLLNITFFYQTNGAFPLFSTDVHGLGSGKILSSHSFFSFFPYFFIGCPLSIFHLSRIFSYPTSRSPSILAVHSPFLASLMFFHLSLPLSSLVCLHPSLSCGLPHFNLLLTNLPVELFSCITYFVRSFIFLSSTLFVRVIRQNQNQLSAAVVVLSTPLSPDTD